MLVLSRRTQQRIMIGESVIITILEIRDGKVRIGIEAPAETAVHREEIFLEIKRCGSRRHAVQDQHDHPGDTVSEQP